MRLLVTGGAGYIGSIACEHLLRAGHEVTVLDDLSSGHADAVPDGCRLVEASLLAPELLPAVVDGHDAVLHFAALSLVGESMQQPVRYLRANVTGAANLLDAMRDCGVRRLVVSSTAACYGEPVRIPIAEDDPTEPTSPYGVSKLAVDRLAAFEAAACGIGAVSLRYFNVAGASVERGERHSPETHLIPIVLEAAAGLRTAVTVHGTDYPTPDGTAIRDYVHVDDLARAHLLALEATGTAGHRVYNLGNGAGFSVRQVIEAAEAVTGVEIPVETGPRRPGDPAVLVASSERIRRELGWEPQHPELAAIVGDAWRWARAHVPAPPPLSAQAAEASSRRAQR